MRGDGCPPSGWRPSHRWAPTGASHSSRPRHGWWSYSPRATVGARTGRRKRHYYVKESVGLAGGLFIASLHTMGLATLTHTPSPMRFLSEALGRPSNEQPFVLFPVGYPAADCVVPELTRKPLGAVAVFNPAPRPVAVKPHPA